MKLIRPFAYALSSFIIATTANAAQVSLSWDPSSSNIDGYRLYSKTNSQSDAQLVWAGSNTKTTVNNLVEGENYTFFVRSYNASEESIDSNHVQYMAPVAEPSTPEETTNTAAPIADAGQDQYVEAGDVVALSGRNSIDMGGGIASYQWKQVVGPAVQIVNANSVDAFFTAPHNGSASYAMAFELTVKNKSGAETQGYCSIYVSPVTSVNEAPVAVAGGEQFVDEGQIVTLNGKSSTDPDDGIASYLWEQISGDVKVTLSGAKTSVATFTAPKVGNGGATLGFRLTVTDKGGLANADTTLVTIEHENMAPIADAGENQKVSAGTKVVLDGSYSSDPEGDDLTYRWRYVAGNVSVTLSNATSAKASFTAPDAGTNGATLTFELSVTDSYGLVSKETCTVEIEPKAAVINVAASIADAGQDQTVKSGSTVRLSGKNSIDMGGGIVSYQWKQVVGPKVNLKNANSMNAAFSAPKTGPLAFELTVTNKYGAQTQGYCSIYIKK